MTRPRRYASSLMRWTTARSGLPSADAGAAAARARRAAAGQRGDGRGGDRRGEGGVAPGAGRRERGDQRDDGAAGEATWRHGDGQGQNPPPASSSADPRVPAGRLLCDEARHAQSFGMFGLRSPRVLAGLGVRGKVVLDLRFGEWGRRRRHHPPPRRATP